MATVRLGKKDIERCRNFSELYVPRAKAYEFGNPKSAERPVNEMIRDSMIGKIAEVGVSKLFKRFGFTVPVDFNQYPVSRHGDDYDFVVSGTKFELKASRSGSRWLLFELNKLNARKDRLPDWLIFAITGWDRSTDQPTGIVRVVGHIPAHKLFETTDKGYVKCASDPLTVYIREGDYLPDTWSRLITDNCGRHMDTLDPNIRDLMHMLGWRKKQ